MPIYFKVGGRGTQQLTNLSKALKESDKKLLREMNKGIRKATVPLVQELHNSAEDTMPKSGGLALDLAMTPIRTQILTGPRSAGIRLRAPGKPPTRDVKSLNAGRLRHPLFGNRKFWYQQSVEPGWWDKPLADPALKEEVAYEIQKVLDNIVKRRLEAI